MVGNLKRFKDHSLQCLISTPEGDLTLNATRLNQIGNLVIIEFSWDNHHFTFSELLTMIGRTPLPPYIKRDPVPNDKERYQTIYSRFDGSVAAPTAGLHFTSGVFETLAKKNIACHEITLHVGAGTFQPIKSDRVIDHAMHSEYIKVTTELLEILSSLTGRVASVGTTTVRTLESMYWLGVKISRSPDISPIDLYLDQWEAYDLPQDLTLKNSFEAFETWMKKQGISELMASTSLMILPGYSFKVVDTLITNFHQPRSTLLLLIAAFIGESWKETYDYALKEGFRFLSYGDSSLLFNQQDG
jgi:S-adenosylmethionine:tRNA ribosyltransferase-isomerase